MPDPAHAPFADLGGAPPAEPSATGEPSRSASSIAAEAAAAAIRGLTPPGSSFKPSQPQHLASDTSEYISANADAQGEYTEDGEYAPPIDDVVADIEVDGAGERSNWGHLTREDLLSFAEQGIDLPISPDDVPAGSEALYAEMAQAILDATNMATTRYAEATEAAVRIADFAKRLQTPEGQERMLLSLAMQAPEVFAKAQQIIHRMESDPDYAEAMQLRMEAQVREEALSRREHAFTESQLVNKAQQVTNRTSRLAKRLGVDEDWAKEQVAQRIILNEQHTGKRDISLAEVDAVVKGLAQRTNAQPRVRPPAQQQRVAQAPQQPASAGGRTPTAAPPRTPADRTAPGGSENHWTQGLRGAIRESGARARSKGL